MNTPAPEKFNKLKTLYSQLLPSMTPEAWEFCKSLQRVRTIKKGDMLLQEGNVCNHVSFINHGLLRMYYMIDGKEKITWFSNEGSYICDCLSFFTRQTAICNIQAIEDTELVETNYENLQLLYQKIPEANIVGRRIAEELLIAFNIGVANNVKYTIDESYSMLIAEKPWLIQRVPQYMIASYLGVTPEALSRVKARLSKVKKPVPEVY